MLFAEHTVDEEFRVFEVTATAPAGRFASFVRAISEGMARVEDFFRRKKRAYTRFNYLGDWHSHPAFALRPSGTDDETMPNRVNDAGAGALFVVLVFRRGPLARPRASRAPGREREDLRPLRIT